MRVFPLLAIALLVCPGCDVRVSDKGAVHVDLVNGKATDEWERTYMLAKGGRIEIINASGSIEVGRSDGPSVGVRATREARSDSDEAASALLRRVEMIEQVTPDRVHIEAQISRRDAPGGFSGPFTRRPSLGVSYHVLLPTGLSATFRTEEGEIRLDKLDGRIEAATTNGGITGRDLSGSVSASTVNGGVQMSLESVRGDVEITAVNGGIRVELARTVDAQLDASTVNGGVRVDDEVPLAATVRERLRVSGRINKGGPRVALHTTNGGVRVLVRER
jgi:Putative adhesin